MRPRRLFSTLSLAAFGLLLCGTSISVAQEIRIDVGGGWGVPTNNVNAQADVEENVRPLPIDLKPGPHAYAAAGFVRTIGEHFALGSRVRVQTSRLRSSVEPCEGGQCTNPEGRLRAATLEGRIIVTTPSWIRPYFLVGLGVVRASVPSVTVRDVENPSLPSTVPFQEVTVTDAGGDIGLGASFPVAGGLSLDTEFRVTGTLPGAKDNAVTVLPFSLGVSYGFE